MAKDLVVAAGYGSLEALRELIAAGHDVDGIWNGVTPLVNAAFARQLGAMEILLDAGADLEASRVDRTPLLAAARNSASEAVTLLLDRGADIEGTDKGGTTPLMMAANHGRFAVLQLLMQAGADVNASAHDGWTPLMYAVLNPSFRDGSAAVSELLAHGADPDARASDGRTAFDIAIAKQKPMLARRLGAASAPPIEHWPWSFQAGGDCALCDGLARFKPRNSKEKVGGIKVDVVLAWIGGPLPESCSTSLSRGVKYVERADVEEWHAAVCPAGAARGGSG